MFRRLELERWRQFKSIDIEFHPHLTVLTGANGAGKTTLLNLLNRHFGWSLQFVSTPVRTKRGLLRFFSGLWRASREDDETARPPREIGRISYSDGSTGVLLIPENVQQVFDVQIQGQQQVPGIFVPSHRPLYGVYQKIDQIPTELDAKQQLYDRYVNELRNSYQPRSRTLLASYRIKESLVSLAMFGYGNDYVQPNPEAIETFEGFQEVLRKVLPPSLGFERFDIRMPELVLMTRSGEFPFDSVSGGVAALIDISWQIFMRSRIDEEFAVVIDEPENHLHPELQRSVLPSLIRSFPSAQFIVATHNPFIVTAVRESNVYVLQYSEANEVVSDLLDWPNKAGSSNKVLREVLGLANALPLWVEDKLEALTETYASRELNEESLAQLKADLSDLNMADLLPDTLTRLLDKRSD